MAGMSVMTKKMLIPFITQGEPRDITWNGPKLTVRLWVGNESHSGSSNRISNQNSHDVEEHDRG